MEKMDKPTVKTDILEVMDSSSPDSNESVSKKRRGRPQKILTEKYPSEKYPSPHSVIEESNELGLGYKILADIFNVPNIRHLLEEPDEKLFGYCDYSIIVKNPMWFTEISRKYANNEYTSLNCIIDDMKLVLENCYMYWGSQHELVNQALKIEELIENHINNFPKHLQKSCSMGDAVKISRNSKKIKDSFPAEENIGFKSKIICNLKMNEMENKQEMEKWEAEVLMSKPESKLINFIPELPEIGQFLRLSKEILGIKEITQYEIERMLLISKESWTLATIMTRLLCTRIIKQNLLYTPIMTYDVWMSLLRKKLGSWYKLYSKNKDKLQMFVKYGIEPKFWGMVGEHNPLVTSDFQSLNFRIKAFILKTLCNAMFHSDKTIEEHFHNAEENSLRGTKIYEDMKFQYMSLFFPEIRVYRSYKGPSYELDINEKHSFETFETGPGAVKITDSICGGNFFLAASNCESLTSLLRLHKRKKKFVGKIRFLISQEQNTKYKMMGLQSLFSQWKKYTEREGAPESSKFYWITKARGCFDESELKKMSSNKHDQTNIISGKRKRFLSRKLCHDDVEVSSSEEDNSDLECGNIRRSDIMKRGKPKTRPYDKYMTHFETIDLGDELSKKKDTQVQSGRVKRMVPNVERKRFRTPKPLCDSKRLPSNIPRIDARILRTRAFFKRSFVNTAIENASKVICSPLKDKNFLMIDMKSQRSTEILNHPLQEKSETLMPFQNVFENNACSSISIDYPNPVSYSCSDHTYAEPIQISSDAYHKENICPDITDLAIPSTSWSNQSQQTLTPQENVSRWFGTDITNVNEAEIAEMFGGQCSPLSDISLSWFDSITLNPLSSERDENIF